MTLIQCVLQLVKQSKTDNKRQLVAALGAIEHAVAASTEGNSVDQRTTCRSVCDALKQQISAEK
jgi:hypothetical protein